MTLCPVFNGGVSLATTRRTSTVAEKRGAGEFFRLGTIKEQVAGPGAPIRIQDLVAAGHLNGQHGICESWDAESGRWIVRLEGGDMKKLRPENCAVEVRPATIATALPELTPLPEPSADVSDEKPAVKVELESNDVVAARLVLRASSLAQLSMVAAQFLHADGFHLPDQQNLYELLLDCILPVIGIKASMQSESKTFDNLQLVSGISAIHAGEILHGDGILKSLVHPCVIQSGLCYSVPHFTGNHAASLGLFFLAGTSSWLVRRTLPYVEEKEDEDEAKKGEEKGFWSALFDDAMEDDDSMGEEKEEDEDEESKSESELPELESDGFEGFVEDAGADPGSSADPYSHSDACKSNK